MLLFFFWFVKKNNIIERSVELRANVDAARLDVCRAVCGTARAARRCVDVIGAASRRARLLRCAARERNDIERADDECRTFVELGRFERRRFVGLLVDLC